MPFFMIKRDSPAKNIWLFRVLIFGYSLYLFVISVVFMNTVTGINEKNNRVFRAFFEKNFSSVVLFADKYLDDMAMAADIAQECFIRLWREKLTFESEDKVKGFLYVMAKRLALNELKHEAIVSRYEQRKMLESEAYFRDNVIEEEVYTMVYKAIDALAPQSRQVILLSLQELSNGEIADRLNISINSVKTLKQNAYKKLRGLLKDYFYLFILIKRMRLF